MNAFVDYLNSTNNIGGNSTGSLAESQVKSIFYDKVKVDRKLGTIIADSVKSQNHQAFILTGHAGDGKTSILVQVMKSLGYLKPGEGICQSGSYADFYYVKDMSELSEGDQDIALRKTLTAPSEGKTSLLISNTGPLLNSFTRLIMRLRTEKQMEFGEKERIELQSKLLTQLDHNSDEPVEIDGFTFALINIARIDNTPFACEILKRIISIELWKECDSCHNAMDCPIRNNIEVVSGHFDRVSAFIEGFYRYLYENDRRMTIRQMVGQISYGITGNLSCTYVQSHMLKKPKFNYNFANLFFGYKGLNESRDGVQIKGIALSKLLKLDYKSLNADYKLFVENDFASYFQPDIKDLLENMVKQNRKHYQIIDEKTAETATKENSFESKFRRAIRRFYLMYGSEPDCDDILNQVFGRNFTLYKRLTSSAKQSMRDKMKLQDIIFKALYIRNTGSMPEGKNELPLTLRREDNVFQNVMLILGNVSKSSILVEQRRTSNKYEDIEMKKELYLRFGKNEFLLSLPMLEYFDNVLQGSIASNINPALTYGIAKLDALLLETYGDRSEIREEDGCKINVLVNTTGGQEIRTYVFEDGKLSIWS